MPSWLLADSLRQLLSQIDTLAPTRSRASDGSIGDAAHASRSSDHNPHLVLNGQPYVTALDLTHDPRGGLDCAWLAMALQRCSDPRVKYVIWSEQIMAGDAGPRPWQWRIYRGVNPHTKHLHISVVADRRCLARNPWALPGLDGAAEPSREGPVLRRGAQGATVKSLQLWLNAHDWEPDLPLLVADEKFGPATERVVRRAQALVGLYPDGIVGPHTRTAFVVRGWRP